MRINFRAGRVGRTAQKQPRRGVAKIAQRLGAGIKWKTGTSPVGTTEVLTHPLKVCGLNEKSTGEGRPLAVPPEPKNWEHMSAAEPARRLMHRIAVWKAVRPRPPLSCFIFGQREAIAEGAHEGSIGLQ